VKRNTLLERCYLLTFGICVHSATETKVGFEVSWDLNPAFTLYDYLQTHRLRTLGKK